MWVYFLIKKLKQHKIFVQGNRNIYIFVYNPFFKIPEIIYCLS